jgi:hypothetical protein
MTTVAVFLCVFGALLFLVGGIRFLVAMFRESVWWLVFHFLFPLTALLFLCVHFKDAWPPPRTCLSGAALIALAVVLAVPSDGFSWRQSVDDACRGAAETGEATSQEAAHPFRAAAGRGAPASAQAMLTMQTVGDYRGKQLVQGGGEVVRILEDDREGSKHQRFIIRLASGRTLLVAHNIDVGQRVSGIKVGDTVEFSGEYADNAEGGVVHWTHRNLRGGGHPDGWLRLNGQTYH